jgi:ubiquinol-cytochrome c reductase cytochrome c subunit
VIAAARLLTVLLLAALGAALPAGAALAQPPDGIVRPDDARGLSPRELGAQLYAGNCVSCHGIDGRGVTAGSAGRGAGDIAGQGPPLRGVGALAADFYLRTGYMPLGSPDEQPTHSRPLFTDREIRALVAYVASLGGGPAIPRPEPQKGSLSEGLELFTEHCAGCHQVVAQGGYVTDARVPPLEDATARQIAQAVRIGPYLMPKFSKKDITDAELNSIVRYVLHSKHPTDRGGWGIGNLGPFPEGIVTWFLAAVVLVMTCMVIGKRLRA